MKTAILTVIAAIVLTSAIAEAQQSPSPASPTPQAQSAPCTTGQSQAATTQNNKPGSFADRLKKRINDESAKFGTRTGVPMPTTDDLGSAGSAKPAPCPPKAAASTTAAAAPQPAPAKLPPDISTSVTLRCTPMTPSPQGGAHQTTLTLPDPKDFALPKATDLLVDSVVLDTAAKTPCYAVKVDPKSGRSFVQQP